MASAAQPGKAPTSLGSALQGGGAWTAACKANGSIFAKETQRLAYSAVTEYRNLNRHPLILYTACVSRHLSVEG